MRLKTLTNSKSEKSSNIELNFRTSFKNFSYFNFVLLKNMKKSTQKQVTGERIKLKYLFNFCANSQQHQFLNNLT